MICDVHHIDSQCGFRPWSWTVERRSLTLPFCRYPAYGALYTALEVLALPAIPLTMTAGLLFGVGPGAAVVSVSATTAATISFLIARYAGVPSLTQFPHVFESSSPAGS